jgi:tetratricopeptide (TPR) repeat protein
MPDPSQGPITFIVPGVEQEVGPARTRAAAPAGATGRLKQSVLVGTQRGGGGGEVRVTAVPGEDVVVLQILNGPELRLHPANARDLMLAQSDRKRSRGANGTEPAAPNEVAVPVQLQWAAVDAAVARGGTRGLGGVLLQAVHVITGVGQGTAANFVANQVVKRVDAQVDPGVYRLGASSLGRLKGNGSPLGTIDAGADPSLILIHGTFSETSGTFSKLWSQHPDLVRSLFQYYKNRVYALDHPTLGESPIANALLLARALPNGARVHLLTHSRGGLVAEVLARACGGAAANADDLEPFSKKANEGERKDLAALLDLVKTKGIRVERVVRVACPARGTLLASKRLDAYVSVLKWGLELAHIPVAPELIDFLGEVARLRADPSVLPGLAAEIPDSPLVTWLHGDGDPIPGDLRVVAGDVQGDSIRSWIKTLLADSFYWTDNDLVVQTRSMYGGTPRAAGATFVLDQGGDVSHFNYFSNDRTAGGIVDALTRAEPPNFRTIGPLSWAGESSAGVRAARRAAADTTPAADKPAVFLLPGILGSNLKVDGKRIWLGLRLINGFARLAYHAAEPDGVEPDGPIDLTYDKLGDFLARTHEVIEFAYDWRRPIEEEARRLASEVDSALAARAKSGKPVQMVAHSMGGVLARVMLLEQPAVWQRMMSRPGARLLMLGTPNGGSWAPMQVLSCDDTFGNTLVTFGAPFKQREARGLMAEFPGFLQLQAGLLDSRLKLDANETWQGLADDDLKRAVERSWWHNADFVRETSAWGIPPQAVLDQAVSLRKRLDLQRAQTLGAFAGQILLVVGKARFTPDGFEVGNDGFVYLDAQEAGDGRVTLQNAQLPGVRTWQVDCDHGHLPAERDAFQAYLELLQQGNTDRLRSVTTTTRGVAEAAAPMHVRSRPSRASAANRPPDSPDESLAPAERERPAAEAAAQEQALSITVHNGDLSYIRLPLLLGHYTAERLTGTERIMDDLIGGTMSNSLKGGLYPDEPGTHQLFWNTRSPQDNPWQLPRPPLVIVAGLGPEAGLQPSELVYTVGQAVLAWGQRLAERPGALPVAFELAATLIASGGSGITVGQSARSIAQGIREANRRLAKIGWPGVGHLHLIELYLDRSTEAWRALQIQTVNAPALFALTPTVQQDVGSNRWLPRPLDPNYRGADYDFLTAVSQPGEPGESIIVYTLDTRRARSEVRAQSTQSHLIGPMLLRASNDTNADPQIGNTLCRLLLPMELDPFLGGTTELVLELDSVTAGIPWELIDPGVPGTDDQTPWAIRSKLLRKLRTKDFREQVSESSADTNVLVIGDPDTNRKDYPELFGARAEAKAVADRLGAATALGSERVRRLVTEDSSDPVVDAQAVINALLDRTTNWRIIHVAGHGEPGEKNDPKGVVLSDGAFLGPREIRSMRKVPELVFVNCCYLGMRASDQLSYDRPAFASGVAEELIKIGVRCVIAAGWAVDDGPAEIFATKFYDALLANSTFIDAVAIAREAAFAEGGNTWAAYQCYGDPNWTLRRDVPDAHRPTTSFGAEFASIASPLDLLVALETMAVKATTPGAKTASVQDKLRHLESRFVQFWGGDGKVAYAFGWAWSQARDPEKAIEWYRRSLAANDGRAPIRAAEQLGNQLARQAEATVARGRQAVKEAEERLSHTKSRTKARREAQREVDKATRALGTAVRQARQQLNEAIALLEKVVALEPTMERESLCGSAYKRLLMIADDSGGRGASQALERMRAHYAKAEELGRQQQLPDVFAQALNRFAADLCLKTGRGRILSPTDISTIRQELDTKARRDPDFWCISGLVELSIYEAIDRGALASERAGIEAAFADLYLRAPKDSGWLSVRDQARFVLTRYARRARGAEASAATALLAAIEGFAAG